MAPYQRSNDTRNATVIHLFPKGITRTEIARLIEKMLHASKKSVSEQVKAFHQRPLHTRYICVYVDTTYIAVGICEDKSKEVLAYTIAPTESAYNWQELLEELKDRGVKDILLFISDGFKDMVDAISNVFSRAKYQSCLVHIARNLSHKIRKARVASLTMLEEFEEEGHSIVKFYLLAGLALPINKIDPSSKAYIYTKSDVLSEKVENAFTQKY